MTLKELRKSKGLSQSECSKYLGISLRSYQNYENNNDKINTGKYNIIYKKIESYDVNYLNKTFDSKINSFKTNVVLGDGIVSFTNSIKHYKKRDCYDYLKKYIEDNFNGKICVLYGLRRTGKTTMLFQLMNELPIDKVAYIKIKISDNMSDLSKDLKLLLENGCKYVFIDEITLMEDFINTASILSDLFASMGMKIVLSGTDSLGFFMANRDELYDRSIMIHTTFIPFGEYSRLLNINSVDRYIEFGGTLKIENMNFDDPDSTFDDVSFRNDESTRKYIDTSISRNIQRTLKNDNYGGYFNQLRELYDKGELTNVINRIVEDMNHHFLLKVVTDKFKSHDLGSSKELLLHDLPNKRATILYDIDEETIIKRLKEIIDIKEKEELLVEVTQEHVNKVKKYLQMLDLLTECNERYENGNNHKFHIITQPGMRYAITKALAYSLMQDVYFRNISEYDKGYIIEKILNNVKGRMLEEIVLLEKSKFATSEEEVFKFKFDNGGEFDMVIYNKKNNTCTIYEIKHSDKIDIRQTRYLNDIEKCKLIKQRFGEITGKYVLYRGENNQVNDIKYLNVEQYLCGL